MKNNAVINARVEEILKVIDARAYTIIYLRDKDGKESLLYSGYLYDALANKSFIDTYGAYKLVGMSIIVSSVTLLIEEG